MLRIYPSVSAAQVKDYFRRALSRGEYFLDGRSLDQEVVGDWGGKAAAMLGLSGRVDREAFDRLCDNLHPATGEKLTPRTKTNRRVAYDFNLHVPKSVSIALEIGGDRRIADVFRECIPETMQELERDVQTRVRTGNQNGSRTTGNMIWAEFVHFTARPVGGAPDPQLHAHLLCHNTTWDETEQRWKAFDVGDIKRDAPYFQAAYHARLKTKLVELGYEIERRGTGWEITGISPELIRAFSRRTAEIEREAKKRGVTDPKKKADLGAQTREGKLDSATMEDLRTLWRQRCSPEQLARIESVAAEARQRDGVADLDVAGQVTRAFESAKEHVFYRSSTVPDRELLAAALDRTTGGVTPEAMRAYMESLVADGHLLRGSWEGQSLLTTPEVYREEQSMLETVRDGKGQHEPLSPSHEFTDAELSAEQRAAARHALESRNSVVLIRGKAGVGKTRLMNEVVQAIESTGTHVQVAAPTAMATHEVLREDGHAGAQTVARLLKDTQLQAKLNGGVLWVDEAGLLSVPEMVALVKLAKDSNARLLLTGDTAQHRSVQRGDAMALLETFAGIEAAEVKQIRRQRHATYREACEALARGAVDKGLAVLHRMGAIREVADEQRPAALAMSYVESVAKGRSTLVISPTHAEGRQVTESIREQLKDKGSIGNEDRPVERLIARHLSESEKADAAMHEPGTVIEFHQNAPGGTRRSDRASVTRAEGGRVFAERHRDGQLIEIPLEHAHRFEVFERSELGVAKGDRLRITRNGRTDGGAHRLNNGSIYEVAGFTKDGRAKLANGWVLGKDFGHVAHGYCVTSNASQGRTVDHVILAQSAESSPAASRQQFYVSVTRGKHEVTIFTDDQDKLLFAASKDAARVSATEALSQQQPDRSLQHEPQSRLSIGLGMMAEHGRKMRQAFNKYIERSKSLGNRERGGEGHERQRDR